MSTGAVAASGAPEILDVEATADSPDASEISVLAQTIVAKPDESAGVEALARAYESGSYRLTPEVLARSLVNYYLESGLPDVRAKKPSGS